MFRRIFEPAVRSDRARKVARRRTMFALEGLESRRVLSTFTWTGAVGTNWSTPGNWLNGTETATKLPGQFDSVVFDGSSGVAADVTASATVKSISIGAGYGGEIKLGSGVNLRAVEAFSLTSGSFDGRDGTLTSGKGFTVAGGTFTAGAGTVVLRPDGAGAINAPGVEFNNVTIAYGAHHINVGGGLKVNGTLTIEGGQRLTGVIYAGGDVTTQAPGMFSATAADKIVIGGGGGGDRTLAAVDGGALPNVEIARQGGTLTLAGDIGVRGNWTHVKGAVAAASSTVTFKAQGIVDSNTMAFGNVAIDAGDHHFYVKRLNVGGDLKIRSIQTINYSGGAGSGAITVGRNLTSEDKSVDGQADITLTGAADAIIKGGDFPNGGIIIAKKSGAAVAAGVTQPLDGPLAINSLASLTGEFQVGHNVSTRAFNAAGNPDGTPVLIFKGARAQTVTYYKTTNPNNQAVVDARVPGLEFSKSGGSVSFVKGAGDVAPGALVVTGGWIVSEGNEAPINLAGHNVSFILSGGSGHRTIATGSSAGFDGVELNPGSGATVTIASMVVNGKLTIGGGSRIDGDVIRARGDVVTRAGGTSVIGSSRIQFEGGADQSLSSEVAEGRILGVVIAKSGGTLKIGTSNVIAVTGGWTYTSGLVSAAESTIKFVGADKSINSGSMTFGNVIVALGSANFMDIVGEAKVAGTLTGAAFNVTGGKVRSGKFVQVS